MVNPDGSEDDWHEHEMFYGIAFADLALVLPLQVAALWLLLMMERTEHLMHWVITSKAWWAFGLST